MKRLIIVSILALTAWAYPIHAASAIAESDQAQFFINYEKFHKQPEKIVPAPDTGKRAASAQKTQNPPVYSGRYYSKEEVQQIIIRYSQQYGIGSETPLCIARLESGYNQFSKNKSSSASGVFQYLSGTWRGTDEGKAGLSVFDVGANVKAAVKYMAIYRSTKPWVVASRCPKLTFQ